jgi:hypothetical protein
MSLNYDESPSPTSLMVAGGYRNFDYGKHEGKNVKRHLKELQYHSVMMHKMLKDTDDLPDWVNAKVTLAADYIDSASHYLKNRVEEMGGLKKRKQTRKQKHKSKKVRKTMRRN